MRIFKKRENVLFIIYVYMYFDWFLLKNFFFENGDYVKVYINVYIYVYVIIIGICVVCCQINIKNIYYVVFKLYIL